MIKASDVMVAKYCAPGRVLLAAALALADRPPGFGQSLVINTIG
jgi:hypothetical protein